ncbi:MAG: hypothetical protein JJE04_25240 [Acidobacteriia bacterium]|nr:hypothetical protein [Terriglobia bacterium]
MPRPQVALALSLFCAASAARAQSVRIYSEFRRIAPNGEVLEQDRPGKSREIISPAVARNGFASFRLVLSAPTGKSFSFHLSDNPEGSFKYTLYRESPARSGQASIPDLLEKVPLPVAGTFTDSSPLTFWLDILVPAAIPAGRIRLEAQLNIDDQWIIYPLEVRVQPASIPRHSAQSFPLPVAQLSSAHSALVPLQNYLCGKPAPAPQSGPLTSRQMIARNAIQDMAMARSLEPALGAPHLHQTLLGFLGATDVKTWCASRLEAPADPELYLRIRDFLIKSAIR